MHTGFFCSVKLKWVWGDDVYVLVTIGKPSIISQEQVIFSVAHVPWMVVFTPAFTILSSFFSFILMYHFCQKKGTYYYSTIAFIVLYMIGFFFNLECFILFLVIFLWNVFICRLHRYMFCEHSDVLLLFICAEKESQDHQKRLSINRRSNQNTVTKISS